MNEFEFPFEELPLIVELGEEQALINGTATVRFHDNGEWSVVGIALDSSRPTTEAERNAAIASCKIPSAFIRGSRALCRDSYAWPYNAIVDRLENYPRFKDAIEAKIDDELAEAGVRRRDDRAEHSTLNRAQTGV